MFDNFTLLVLFSQSCQAYYGCAHCEICHLVGVHGVCYGGYRQFLPPDSPYRVKEFVIDGGRYMFRDVEKRPAPTERTNQTASACIALATTSQPFRGHKGFPFFSRWRGVDWTSNFCDIMHDYKTVCEMLLKGLVGYLYKGGVYHNWNKDGVHRLDCKVYGTFAEVFDESVKLPWRLDREAIKTLDR